ncbi:MAG: hypothetical protein ABSE84_33870 [Isosphaeraceae bacterium]
MIRRFARRVLVLLLAVVLVLMVIRARTGLRLPPLGRWAGSRTSPRRLSRMPVARPGRPDLL